MKVVNLDSLGQSGRPVVKRRARPLGSLLGAVGCVLIASAASAQDPAPAPAEPPAAEAPAAPAQPAPAQPAPTEPPAAEAPPAAAPPAAEVAPPAEAAPAAAVAAEEVALPGDTAADDDLDEVVVTVDRRRKDLQDYSGTASAFSEKQLSRVGITSVQGLGTKVPGLQIGVQEGNTEVYIRGVGNDNNAEHGDMGVALHLDGVYLPRPRGVGAMFYDIERVEVNSGPQGTLRGRNAQGGSVNIITNKPKLGEFGANAEATFGTFAERRFQGMVNIPLGDLLAVRLAGFSSYHDPHWENGGPLHDLTPPQNEDAYAFRGQVKWQPVQPLTILAGYDFVAERGSGYIGANFDDPLNYVNDNGTPDEADDFNQTIPPDAIDNPRRIFQHGLNPSVDMKHQGGRLEISYDLGPVIVEALGSYRDLVYKQVNGSSAGVIYPGFPFDTQGTDFFGTAHWDTRSQSTVAELRFLAPDSARFRWTVGGFMLLEDQQIGLYQTSDPADDYSGAEFNMPDVYGDSMAAYADATFSVVDEFRVLGGVRLTTETKGRKNGLAMQRGGMPNNPNGDIRFGTEGFRPAFRDRPTYTLPANATVDDRVNLFLDGIASFGARDTLPQYICNDPPQAAMGQEQQPRIAIDPDTGTFRCTAGVNDALGATGFAYTAVPQNSEVSNTFLDYRAGVEYDLTKDNLLYFTVSTAHKAAGYNDTVTRPDGVEVFNEYYDPETVTAFELGSKNVFLDRRLKANASAFFYVYQNQVFQQIVQIAPSNADSDVETQETSQRQNAASSNLYGLDLDLVYALPAGLEVELHALFLNAKYGERTLVTDGRIDYSVSNYEVDIDGNWLPRASPYTLNYALSQLIFTESGSFNWIVQGQTVGKHYMTVFNGEGNLLPEANGNTPMGNARYDALLEDASRLTDVVPTYTRFDLGAGWTHPDGRLSISGYVNNAFNIAYATTIISTPDLNLRFFNPPRTAGVRMRVDW